MIGRRASSRMSVALQMPVTLSATKATVPLGDVSKDAVIPRVYADRTQASCRRVMLVTGGGGRHRERGSCW